MYIEIGKTQRLYFKSYIVLIEYSLFASPLSQYIHVHIYFFFFNFIFYFRVGIMNITMSQGGDGTKTFYYVVQERMKIDLGFYETSFVYTFPANTTVIQEKASIEYNTIKMGGFVKIIQRWKLADSTNANEDKITLLEDQIELTTFRILEQYGKKVAINAHSTHSIF